MSRRPSRPPRVSAPPADVIYGANPVREALRVTPPILETLYTLPRAEAVATLRELARANGVRVETTDQGTLDRLTGGGHHQGVAARTRPFAYQAVEDLLAGDGRLLVALDGVHDPQNLGAIIRAAEVLGACGLILPRDRSAAVTPAAIRASSGAALHLPVAQVVNLVRALADAKARGWWIVGLEADGSMEFQDLPALDRALLVVGGEGEGLRRLTREDSDFLVRIPVRGRTASLNAAVAAGIGLHALAVALWARPPKPR